MPLKFKSGDQVRQVVPAPVEGTVAEIKVDAEGGRVLYHVLTPNADDPESPHGRFFAEDEIEPLAE